jgi:hypothetical protein
MAYQWYQYQRRIAISLEIWQWLMKIIRQYQHQQWRHQRERETQ